MPKAKTKWIDKDDVIDEGRYRITVRVPSDDLNAILDEAAAYGAVELVEMEVFDNGKS